jgi:hypothetical protein
VCAPAEDRSLRAEIERALAMTECPRERASRAMDFPKPAEAPVMNQTGGWDVVDIFAAFASDGWVFLRV